MSSPCLALLQRNISRNANRPSRLSCLQGGVQRTCVVQFVIMPHDEAAEQAFPEDEPV